MNTDPTNTTFEPGAPSAGGGIPLCVPEIRGNEWRYIKECLDTNWVSSVGEYVTRFERQVADYVGTRHAVATSNGTAALHIALLVAGVQPDDEVLLPALTFIAPANAVRYVGAWPVFVDVEPEYWQMDTQRVADFIQNDCQWDGEHLVNRHTGRRVSAILPVHILGHPVDMNPLLELARAYNLIVIEDATESLGAKYRGQMAGSLGDAACFSFNGNKIITTGGGGMLVTNREDWAQRAKYLTTQAKDDPVEYIHHTVGYNYRLTNIQAAMGVAQMENLEAYIAAKREIAARYNAAFADLPGIQPMQEAPWAFSIHWLYTVRVDPVEFGIDRRELHQRLATEGIQSRPLWQPLHLSPAFADQEHRPCPVAERLNREALSLPCSVGLTPAEAERVITAVRAAHRQ